MRKNPHNLYWVTGADGAEDWFVSTRTPRSASRFYEDYIGIDKNNATAELVLSNIELPKFESGSPPCWLSLNDLQALGFKVLNPEPGLSTVTLGNRTFSEGYFEMRSGQVTGSPQQRGRRSRQCGLDVQEDRTYGDRRQAAWRIGGWRAQRTTHAGTLLVRERAGSGQEPIYNRLATRNRLPVYLPGRECPAKNPSAGVQVRPSRNGY